MSDALIPVITNAGLAAACAAGNGLQATISQVGVGVGQGPLTAGAGVGYTPATTQTALMNEVLRVPILSGAPLGGNAFEVLATVPASATPANFVIQEVGFYLSTGTLFAVWSSPQFPLAAKTALADVDLAFDLFLQQLPPGSIAITVTNPGYAPTAGVLAELLAQQANLFTQALRLQQRLFTSHN